MKNWKKNSLLASCFEEIQEIFELDPPFLPNLAQLIQPVATHKPERKGLECPAPPPGSHHGKENNKLYQCPAPVPDQRKGKEHSKPFGTEAFEMPCGVFPHQNPTTRQIYPQVIPLPTHVIKAAQEGKQPFEFNAFKNAIDPFLCGVCSMRKKSIVFGCGHIVCEEDSKKTSLCPYCGAPIQSKFKIFL